MNNHLPKTREQELAQEIARGLGEEELLPIYLSFVRRYPEDVIRRAYQETIAFPIESIRKTRGAVFNYLLKKYAREAQSNIQDPGH